MPYLNTSSRWEREHRIAMRRGQWATIDMYLAEKRRAQKYKDSRVRKQSDTIAPMTHGTRHTPAVPSLEDYDHGHSWNVD